MTMRIVKVLCVSAALTALVGCQNVEESMSLRKPTARIMGMQFQDADAYGATVVFDVQIVNYYPADLPLRHVSYTVSSRGKGFLGGAQEIAITIPVNGSQTVSLPVRIDYVNTLRLLGGVQPGATIPYEAEVELTIDTPRLGTIVLPLSKIGEVTLPTLPGVDVDKLLNSVK